MSSKLSGCLIVIALFTLASCGSSMDDEEQDESESQSGGECTVPPGTYTETWSDAGGDCPQEVVNSLTSQRRDREVEKDTECQTMTISDSGTADNGCEYEYTYSVEGTDSGLGDGEVSVTYSSCPSGASCTHDFNVYYEKR
jgi:hypothetical protein